MTLLPLMPCFLANVGKCKPSPANKASAACNRRISVTVVFIVDTSVTKSTADGRTDHVRAGSEFRFIKVL